MNLSLINKIILCVSPLILSGCSSIMSHAGPPQGYYSGAKNNIEMIKDENTGWVMKPLLAIDLPFSALMDTLLLPYDYMRSDNDPQKDSPKKRVESLEKQQNNINK
ncbi:YceK/YidQ family lipoprotein [Moellerella wisconsensis]|uniref:YceK/YidQ family lipoprotein n=1 Tax=Moellerella wisconsensis TaxID=158849 RepID=UPI00241091F4|nr:YceK/YidQ family lipoprotein [Moellerella wisconsensis]